MAEHKAIEFIPVKQWSTENVQFYLITFFYFSRQCTRRQVPPTKAISPDVYMWYITEDEYLRLSKLFGRDFQETRLGGTKVHGLPVPCRDCGKYTEFIDWWDSMILFCQSLSIVKLGFGRLYNAVCTLQSSCSMRWGTAARVMKTCMMCTVQSAVLLSLTHVIRVKEEPHTSVSPKCVVHWLDRATHSYGRQNQPINRSDYPVKFKKGERNPNLDKVMRWLYCCRLWLIVFPLDLAYVG